MLGWGGLLREEGTLLPRLSEDSKPVTNVDPELTSSDDDEVEDVDEELLKFSLEDGTLSPTPEEVEVGVTFPPLESDEEGIVVDVVFALELPPEETDIVVVGIMFLDVEEEPEPPPVWEVSRRALLFKLFTG